MRLDLAMVVSVMTFLIFAVLSDSQPLWSQGFLHSCHSGSCTFLLHPASPPALQNLSLLLCQGMKEDENWRKHSETPAESLNGARWEKKQSQDRLKMQKFSYSLLKGYTLQVDEFFRFLKTIMKGNCYMILPRKSHRLQYKWIWGGGETSGGWWYQICSVTKPSILPLAGERLLREKNNVNFTFFVFKNCPSFCPHFVSEFGMSWRNTKTH